MKMAAAGGGGMKFSAKSRISSVEVDAVNNGEIRWNHLEGISLCTSPPHRQMQFIVIQTLVGVKLWKILFFFPFRAI